MKRKTIALNKKLILNKENIAPLDARSMQALAGGATVPDNGCVGSSHCDIRFTRQPEHCMIQVTQDPRICGVNTLKCQG